MDRSEYNRLQYLKHRESRLAKQKEYYANNKDTRNTYNKEYSEKNRESVSAHENLKKGCNV